MILLDSTAYDPEENLDRRIRKQKPKNKPITMLNSRHRDQ